MLGRPMSYRATCAAFLLLAALVLPPNGARAADAETDVADDVPVHHYVRLDAITVTLFGENSVDGLYTVLPTLEIADADQRSIVLESNSKLRDAMFVELHKLVSRRKGLAIPLDAVKAHLRSVARRELGEEVVVDLFVENVLRKDE